MSVDTAVRVAAVIAALLLLSGIVSAFVISKVLPKILSLVVCAALALLVWGQRSNVKDCASRAVVADTTCSFVGFDVDVKIPRRPGTESTG